MTAPATLPCKAASSVTGRVWPTSSWALTVATLLARFERLMLVARPVTTTSSRARVSGTSVTASGAPVRACVRVR